MTTPDQPPPPGRKHRPPVIGTQTGKRGCLASGVVVTPAPTASARRRSGSSAWTACTRAAGRHRRPTTVFGGRPARTAVVTWTLIAVNVLLFLVELGRPSIATDWGLLGYAQINSGPLQGIASGQWYRLITSAFLPPAGGGIGGLGFFDILFNMWALWAVGPSLEQLLGRGRFITVYLLSALGGARRVLPDRPAERARARRQRRDLRPVRRLVRGLQAAADRHQGDPGADRDQPGVQLHLPRRRSPGRTTWAG